jgi:two-component system, cell cycle sensor histidine kinase and response regulator CckA
MARVRSRKVDLVFTDLVMPVQEGLETIRALRREFPEIRIVAMSGAFGGDILRVAEHVGALATLRKPADPPEVLRVVRQALQPGVTPQ